MCVPAARLALLHVAVLELAEPAGSATAEQPEIDDAPSLKLTDPVGLAPVTVAVKVTFAPTSDGLVELATRGTARRLVDHLRQRGCWSSQCCRHHRHRWPTMLCVPTREARAAARRGLGVGGAGGQRHRTAAGQRRAVGGEARPLPVGAVPVTVAVKVTLVPTTDRIGRARQRGTARGGVDHLRQGGAGRAHCYPHRRHRWPRCCACRRARLALLHVAVLLLAAPAGRATALQPADRCCRRQ